MFISDPMTEDQIKARRAASGAGQYDEIWDGVYVVAPFPNDEHQEIVAELIAAFHAVVVAAGLGKVRPNVNVSDRDEGWTENYRGPDVAVFLRGTKAVNRKTHWVGGPDFAVEILSEGDRAREKLDFYAKVHVREVLIVDRSPWRLELYRLARRRLGLAGVSTPEASETLASKVLPVRFRLLADRPRPSIEIVHADGRRWEV